VSKKKAVSLSINLLPKDPFFETGLGKTMRWALSVGRYIVIFTELVVIVSFGSRFKLDREVTDLNDSIHQKQTIVESYGELENNFRLAQLKIEQFQQIEQQTNIVDIFPALSEITPRDIQLTDLTIKPTSVSFEGTTRSQNSFNLLINNIQLSPIFSNVSVNRIESGQTNEPGFHFQITADTKNVEKISKDKR
jgi:Tfp pilus assembly protein PilN